ncbi:hypothetical protein [Virgibacillus litoralis]|uniref:Uncharacterized protein n=1 Tax=Virgibacillus litoralis TaxID=578221 RepID=A0ABS4H8F5_9BACI|nr:hypothetical protein [Virgibacillus litoralis]MBP1947195.1 hypothetical protein [Virgibacillus litoralis]
MNNKLRRALFIIGTILMLIGIVLDFLKDAPESSPYSMPLLIVGGILVTAARFYKSSKNK